MVSVSRGLQGFVLRAAGFQLAGTIKCETSLFGSMGVDDADDDVFIQQVPRGLACGRHHWRGDPVNQDDLAVAAIIVYKQIVRCTWPTAWPRACV